MSSYVREKVLRIPAYPKIEDHLKSLMREEDREDWADELEYKLRDLFGYADIGKFQRAPTVELFIDFVLEYEYDADGEYGYVRELYDNEKELFRPVFEKLAPDIDMNLVHLVEFCWYNCSEAPDYYSLTESPFYAEITSIPQAK